MLFTTNFVILKRKMFWFSSPIRPKSFKESLYKYLITDDIWSKQRTKNGYEKPNKKKLMDTFAGQPYINTLYSFQSLIPKGIEKKTKIKILDYYIKKLNNNKTLHDKIEFEINMLLLHFKLFMANLLLLSQFCIFNFKTLQLKL